MKGGRGWEGARDERKGERGVGVSVGVGVGLSGVWVCIS
jgi:hypothetical protein